MGSAEGLARRLRLRLATGVTTLELSSPALARSFCAGFAKSVTAQGYVNSHPLCLEVQGLACRLL